MDINTITYIACAVTGTVVLGSISAFFSYKKTMDEKYKYLYNRVESIYDRFEKICIDNHEKEIRQQQQQAIPVSIASEHSIPLLDPVNYSTHPFMNYDKEDVYITM